MTRRVLITGANKGIGLAIARGALEQTEDVSVLLGSRSLERGQTARESVVAERPSWSDRLEVLQIDVARDDSVEEAAQAVVARHGSSGSLYGIVNNAGIGQGNPMQAILDVNVYGPRRVCDAFIPLVRAGGRVVNVASASGPNYVSECSAEDRALLTDPGVTWEQIDGYARTCLELDARGAFDRGNGSAYGLSKALLNAYTLLLAREHPELTVNACTPGFIETDMTRSLLEQRNASAEELGMRPPRAGARAPLHLLLGDVEASGWYFGSDAERSPLHRYRSPGDPPYRGETRA